MLPLVESGWNGRWIVPDLPGHGRSAAQDSYAIGMQAAALASALADAGRVTILGHSLGGVLGLVLASSWFGVAVERVVGLGIKVRWTDQERAWAESRRAATIRNYGSRAEAASAFLRSSGLEGLLASDDPVVETGLVRTPNGWRLAADPTTPTAGAPPMQSLLAAAGCRVELACGDRDKLVGIDDLRELDPSARSLAGLGHNAHVENPAEVWSLVAEASS
jgi:pimeloyl-ACP methyl ester carboxylesterase